MRPGTQRTAYVLAADVTLSFGGDKLRGFYYWSQTRLGVRARQSRQKTNGSLRELEENGLLHRSEKQRGYNHPRTIELEPRLLSEVWRSVLRAVERILRFDEGDTRRRSLRSPLRYRLRHILRASPGGPRPSASSSLDGKLPSLEEALGRFRRKWQRGDGGWRVNCPCHGSHSTSKRSLALAEGENGLLLYHCFGGCSHEAVRAALVAGVGGAA